MKLKIMSKLNGLENYLSELCQYLGHVNRHHNFCDYLKGLLLVEGRKSVEPMAAHLIRLIHVHVIKHYIISSLTRRGQMNAFWIKPGNGLTLRSRVQTNATG